MAIATRPEFWSSGMVLREGQRSRQVLARFGSPSVGLVPDQEPDDPARVLAAVRDHPNPKTYWADPTQLSPSPTLNVLVASPLLDERHAVIGYLCGLCRGPNAPPQTDRFQATLMDLIATHTAKAKGTLKA